MNFILQKDMNKMKQGWEIKKLGEVCDIVGGSTPKTSEPSYWDGEHYWITPAELDGSKYISSTSRTITDEGVKSTHLQLLPSGIVLLSSRAPIGKVAITTAPMYCNQGFKNLVCSDKLYNEFAYWFLFHNTDYLNSLGTGATFKEISKRVVEQIPISIPPREEQERIVEELDCLSGVIEKKREQLRELDALAQSIFYQMFGDEVGQSNKWDSCSIGDIYKFQYGKGNKIPESKGEYPCYGSNGQVGFHTEFNAEDSPIIGHIGAYAGIVIWARGKHYVTYNGVICKLKHKGFHPIYGYYLLKAQNYMDSARGGAAQPFVSYNMLEAPIVYMPPLTLQQEFADKIEAIEKQKELIKQSITQTEELFNSRMDYYFN